MEEIILSIIVPIYKSEKYLSKCLYSALNQKTNYHYEVIACIDKSDDSSEEIIDEYAKYYSNLVKIVNPYRYGVGKSRIEGVKNAKGKYITFLDADDYINDNAVNIIVNELRTNADVINFSFSYINAKNKIKPYYFGNKNSKMTDIYDGLKFFFLDINMRGFLWNKVFKRSLFAYPLLSFFDINDMFEDVALTFSLLINSKKIYLSNKSYYYYRKGVSTSATSIKRSDRTIAHIAVFAAIKIYLQNIGNEKLLKIYHSYLWRAKLSFKFDAILDKRNDNIKTKNILKKEYHSLKYENPLSIKGKPYEYALSKALPSFNDAPLKD